MFAKLKVYAYIVQGRDLVVFEQPHAPEAGIQVPGGTVEEGEALDAAVLREAVEETGLPGLMIARYLGQHTRDMRDYGRSGYHQRHFYYLTCATTIPPCWQHWEQYSSEPITGPGRLFAFTRTPLDNLPPLIADFDVFIPELRRVLGELT